MTGRIPMIGWPPLPTKKDGRTPIPTVSLDTQSLLSTQVVGADEGERGDTRSLLWSLVQADRSLKETGVDEQTRLTGGS